MRQGMPQVTGTPAETRAHCLPHLGPGTLLPLNASDSVMVTEMNSGSVRNPAHFGWNGDRWAKLVGARFQSGYID